MSYLPRLLLFRKPERLTSSIGSSKQKWHCSSSQSFGTSFRINSSYTTMAAFGLTVFSLSTLYAFQKSNNNHKSKVSADSGSNNDKQSVTNNNNNNYNNNKCPPWNFEWDNRSFTSTNRSIRFITLVRHGQYVHDPDPDKKILTTLGRSQASITGKKIAASGIQYDSIICSEMVRARETVDIITKEMFDGSNENNKIKIKYDENLNEGAPSLIVPERDDLTKSGFFDSLDDDSLRMNKAFESYIHRNDNDKDEQILIIGHGNVFRYFLCKALQIPPEAWLRFSICNCSITKFKILSDGRVAIQQIGGDGHFKKDQVTFN